MYHSSFDPTFVRHDAAGGETPYDDLASRPAQQPPERHSPSDDAIDAALRCVPLPDGLLTRLSMIVRVIPDESADHADWLGC